MIRKTLLTVGMVACAIGSLFLGNEMQKDQIREAVEEDRRNRDDGSKEES